MNKMVISLVLLLLLAPPRVYASDGESIIKIRTIEVAPFGIKKAGKTSGIYHDLSNLIVTNAGYRFNNKIEPHPRILRGIQYGTVDVTIVLCGSASDAHFDKIAALPSKKTVILGRKGSNFNELSNLYGKTVAYLRGSRLSEQILNDKNIIKHHVKNYLLGLKMLQAGRVDAILGTVKSIKGAQLVLQKETKQKMALSKPLVVGTVTPCVFMSKKSHAYLDIKKLKASFLQLQAQGTLDKLVARYAKKPKKSPLK